MAEPSVAAEVHEPLDVHVDLTTKVTFDLEVLVDAIADLSDVILVELVSTFALRECPQSSQICFAWCGPIP